MKPYQSSALTSIETYMYGLKSRAQLQHCLGHAAFPVELTNLLALRSRYSRQVRPVTLKPFLIKAVALAVSENPGANRILFKRIPFGRRIVSFDSVDVNVPITRTVNDELVIFVGIIRNADKLTISEIQDQLSHLQRDPPEESEFLQKIDKLKKSPPMMVRLYHWLMSRSPAFYLKNAGTCGVTSLDGVPGGHFFPIGPTTAIFGLGGIDDEVVVRDGSQQIRKMLQVSLSLDNYVASGPEGLGLTHTFRSLIETGSYVEAELDEMRQAKTATRAGEQS